MKVSRKGISTNDSQKCELGPKPKNDVHYYEMMSKVIFRSGLNRKVIEAKWPRFTKVFKGFDPNKAAQLTDKDLDKMMKDSGLIRNFPKLEATVKNAREFVKIKEEFGSFGKYLRSLARESEDALCMGISKRFSYMGESTVIFFLRAVGEELPEKMRKMSFRR